MLHVGSTIFIGRRAYRNELKGAEAHTFLHVRGEVQALGFDVALHDFLQAGFEDGYLAATQHVDLALIQVDAEHVVAHFGETRACHQAHVARSHDSQFHFLFL